MNSTRRRRSKRVLIPHLVIVRSSCHEGDVSGDAPATDDMYLEAPQYSKNMGKLRWCDIAQ